MLEQKGVSVEENQTKTVEQIHFLGEEDFLPVMATENKAWREACVTSGYFKTYDGKNMHYYIAKPEHPKAAVVIVHGFCEFWGKYHEMAWYYYQAGYAVYFMEQRGHGYSEGKLPEVDVVHIDSYDVYVEDFKSFLDQIVLPDTEGLKKVLFAHSMGGAVSALFLEKYPQYFDSAILSSPMWKMKAGEYSKSVVLCIRLLSKIAGKYRKIAPGQKRFDGIRVFETSSTLSKPRYDYLFDLRLEDEHYQTYGASLGWALASMDATRKLRKHADRMQGKIYLMTAGQDHLVDPAGYDEVLQRNPKIKRRDYASSRHEIFNATVDTRLRYYQDVLQSLEDLT